MFEGKSHGGAPFFVAVMVLCGGRQNLVFLVTRDCVAISDSQVTFYNVISLLDIDP